MTTNGYLLDAETLSRLVSFGVTEYQISLDGPRDLHDRSRVTTRGGGSFERIWHNLLAVRDSTFTVKVTLRLHYRRDTFGELFPLIELVNREFADDARFQVLFKAIERLGGRNDDAIDPVSETRQEVIEATLRSKLRFPDRAVHFDTYVCYAAAANSLVVRSNGDLNKCTVALDSEVNRIGRLHADGSVTIDQEKFKRWIAPLLSGDRRLMECPYAQMRTGPLVDAPAAAQAVRPAGGLISA